MWKDSIRNIVVIFQPNILRIVGFYVRHSAKVFENISKYPLRFCNLYRIIKSILDVRNTQPQLHDPGPRPWN